MTATEANTTTAEYARILFNGGADIDETRDRSTEENPPAAAPETPAAQTPKRAKTNTEKPADVTQKLAIGDASSWTPRDYVAVAPASLPDVVSGHRDRYQDIGNPAGKVLYALYAFGAVPAGIVLNLVSLAAAHASVAINEPARWRSALLGVLFLAIITGGIVWAASA